MKFGIHGNIPIFISQCTYRPPITDLAFTLHNLVFELSIFDWIARGGISDPAGAAQRLAQGFATFVSFFLDGNLAKVTNQTPFAWDWDTTRVANGWHLIEIRGADEKGTVVNTVLKKALVDN